MQKIMDNIPISGIRDISIYLKKHFENAVFLLYGELGSGKTTLVRDFCLLFGIENVHSPSFNIMHIYKNSKPILHIDFYRIKTIEEINELYLYEYIDNADYTFIEWPYEQFDLSMYNTVKVYIDYNDKHTRNYRIIA